MTPANEITDPAAAAGARVLLIDDDEFTRTTVARLLKGQGHEVVAVEGGRAALQFLTAGKSGIDLVLTDIMMPDMDGLELIRRVRANWPSLGIIAMSAGGKLIQSNFLPIAQALGADFSVSKPCSGDQLAQAIARMRPGLGRNRA